MTDEFGLLVMTNGRRDYLQSTLEAARLKGLLDQCAQVVIHDDTGDRDTQGWLRKRIAGAEVVCNPGKRGFTPAMRSAWATAAALDVEHVFWLEEDFVLNRPIDLTDLRAVLTTQPRLAQLVLKRQAWYPIELAAGGLVEARPGEFTERTDGTYWWTEHEGCYWMNPHLVSSVFLATHEWPDVKWSEQVFGHSVIAEGQTGALWGRMYAPPLVTHIGRKRLGHSH